MIGSSPFSVCIIQGPVVQRDVWAILAIICGPINNFSVDRNSGQDVVGCKIIQDVSVSKNVSC